MREAANDNAASTELEDALAACPGPRSGDRWWWHWRHLVMMDFGRRLDEAGDPLWPEAAEYLRHQLDFERAMGN